MKLTTLQIKNFRSLRNTEIDLEDDISIVVGKNNAGKTSLLLILERFLSRGTPRFDLNDFNVDFQAHIERLLKGEIEPEDPYPFCGISLRLHITYGENDDLANVGKKVVMDLHPDNNTIILDYLYHLPPENLEVMRRDYHAIITRKKKKQQEKDQEQEQATHDFLREFHSNYFVVSRRSVYFDHVTKVVMDDNFVDLIKEQINLDDVIAFKWINARRSVSNKDTDRGLSTMSAKIYSAMAADVGDNEIFENFKDALIKTDTDLDTIYKELFKSIIDDVRQFGGMKVGDTELQIKSTLQQQQLLEGNTTVMYGHGAKRHVLPETYNGLGYLNLISMIFEMKIILNEFKRGNRPKPADINLLFIEEPEAHTHPQMQAVFIKNIKQLIGTSVHNADGVSRPLQTILSTHSAHIVSESDFDAIKYFKRTGEGTSSKSLKALEALYVAASGHNGNYKFLKQYLTLNRSQLFFADKAILVEGDTERILLSAMMRKQDQIDAAAAYEANKPTSLALLSQNISVIEVGAHSHIFEIFLDFIGVRTLIITDIDAGKEEPRMRDGKPAASKATGKPILDVVSWPVDGATHTTNRSLRYFFSVEHDLSFFINLKLADKTVWKDPATNIWGSHPSGQVLCVFQVSEDDEAGIPYHASSFEDAFFHINRKFMKDVYEKGEAVSRASFPSLKPSFFEDYLGGGGSYKMADKGITKKPAFAIEILLGSETITVAKKSPKGIPRDFTFEFSNWKTPQYIEEGLTWIKAD